MSESRQERQEVNDIKKELARVDHRKKNKLEIIREFQQVKSMRFVAVEVANLQFVT